MEQVNFIIANRIRHARIVKRMSRAQHCAINVKLMLLFSLFFTFSVDAAPRVIVAGDNVFLSAQILGCDTTVRPVEYAEVLESGEATFFENIKLKLVGLTEEQVASMIADKIGERTGSRPKSLQVKVIPYTDPETNSIWLLRLLNERRMTCQPERILPPDLPKDAPEWKAEILLA